MGKVATKKGAKKRGRAIGGAKHKNGSLNMSHYLRQAMEKLVAEGWDLHTVPTAEIVAKGKSLIRDKKLRDSFEPTNAQVSIVKRSFTNGSPTRKPGRPSYESLGYTEEAA